MNKFEIKDISGGSNHKTLKVKDKVLKIGNDEKFKQQLNVLEKDINNFPKIIEKGENFYEIPFYNGYSIPKINSNSLKYSKNDIEYIIKLIQQNKTKENIDFDISNYINKKVTPLLEKFDLMLFNNSFNLIKEIDRKQNDFHGDMTRENIMFNSKNNIFLDPNPSEFESYGLEIAKFFTSFFFNYEELKENEKYENSIENKKILLDIYNKLTENEKYLILFYSASHFIRILPYNNKQIFKDMYNLITLNYFNEITKYKDYIVFDLDGVLVDTCAINAQSYSLAINEYATQHNERYNDLFEKYKSFYGLSYKELIKNIVINISDEDIEKIHKRKIEIYKSKTNQVMLNDLMYRFYLHKLIEKNVVIYTSASPECTKLLLTNKMIPYKQIIYSNNKNPEDLKNKLGTNSYCLIEDNLDTIEKFESAGIYCLGVKR